VSKRQAIDLVFTVVREVLMCKKLVLVLVLTVVLVGAAIVVPTNSDLVDTVDRVQPSVVQIEVVGEYGYE